LFVLGRHPERSEGSLYFVFAVACSPARQEWRYLRSNVARIARQPQPRLK
jgi:hypothetical protein